MQQQRQHLRPGSHRPTKPQAAKQRASLLGSFCFPLAYLWFLLWCPFDLFFVVCVLYVKRKNNCFPLVSQYFKKKRHDQAPDSPKSPWRPSEGNETWHDPREKSSSWWLPFRESRPHSQTPVDSLPSKNKWYWQIKASSKISQKL